MDVVLFLKEKNHKPNFDTDFESKSIKILFKQTGKYILIALIAYIQICNLTYLSNQLETIQLETNKHVLNHDLYYHNLYRYS